MSETNGQTGPEEKDVRKYVGTPPFAKDVIDIGAGEGSRLVSERKVTLDHALANKLMSHADVPGERKLGDRWVDHLVREMYQKTFKYENTSLATAKCLENGVTYRENGQHTCWAALIMPTDFPHGKVRVLEYECDTMADVRQLYGSFDVHKGRSKAVITKAGLLDTPEFNGVPVRTIRGLASGLAFWLWEKSDERGKHDGKEISYLLTNDHLQTACRVASFAAESGGFTKCRWLDRSAVYGALFETYAAVSTKATEFWAAVRDGSEMKADDPRFKLNRLLMTAKMASPNTKVKNTRILQAEELYRCCVHAWNAWRKGDTMTGVLKGPMGSKRPRAR